MRIYFLLNPSNPKRLWDYREAAGQAAKRFGCDARFGQVDRSRKQASDPLIKQAIDDGCERIVAIGGDGTLNRTINALSAMKHLSKVSLAVVPAGTCNDFARLLNLKSRRVDEAMRLACTGSARETDLGQMDKRLFLNNAGFGRRKALPAGRRARALRTLRNFQPTPLIARWDKGRLEGQFFMGIVCNAPYFSKGLYFSRQARVHDGLLDVYLVPRMPKWLLLSRLVLGRLGRSIASRHMVTLRVPHIQFDAQGDLWPQADGEPPAAKAVSRVSFGVADEKAMIVVPDNKSSIFWS